MTNNCSQISIQTSQQFPKIQKPFSMMNSSQLRLAPQPCQTYSQICSICCQAKQRGGDALDSLRLQLICYQCWHNHIKSFVSRITYKIGDDIMNPFNSGLPINVVKCINSLKKNDAQEIQQILFRKYSAFTKEIQKCPSQTCDFVYIGQKCKWGSRQNIYNCPKCEMPLTPNKAFTLKSLMASFYLLMANKCPKCDIPIQKISGCPHMTCPCGHHFCWYCYKDHPSGTLKRVYQLHSIPECAFIFLSKIILFLICLINLMVTFNGNWMIRYIFGVLGTVFSVVIRSAILDGFILLQVLFIMMQKRRAYSRIHSKKAKYLIIFLLINLAGIAVLYLFDQILFFTQILIGQLIIAAVGVAIVVAVTYSIETWFEFIA